MIDEIIKKYNQFSDALVISFSYKSLFAYNRLIEKNKSNQNDTSVEIEVIIHVLNSQLGDKWEIIKIRFCNVLAFRFTEEKNASSTVVMSAFIESKADEIIFDFFPLQYSDHLAMNPNSDFCIHCKRVKYEVLEPTGYL